MMTMGYIVRIGGPLSHDIWHVALADPDIALQVVRDAAGPDAGYKEAHIVGGLGADQLTHLGLIPGQVQKKIRKP